MSDLEENQEKPLPFHEYLPQAIRKAAEDGHTARYLTLVKEVKDVKLPDGHSEIAEAIADGEAILSSMIRSIITSALYKLTMESIEKPAKDAEKGMASGSADEEKPVETVPKDSQKDGSLELNLAITDLIKCIGQIGAIDKEKYKTDLLELVSSLGATENPAIIQLRQMIKNVFLPLPSATETDSGGKTDIIGNKPSSSDKIFFPIELKTDENATGTGPSEEISEADQRIQQNRAKGRKGPDNKNED